MPRLCIFSSKAVSLTNVAKDIASVARTIGLDVKIFSYILPSFEAISVCDYVMYIMTVSPVWATHWILNARDVYRRGQGRPALFYATVEGEIKRQLVHRWMLSCVPYIANSEYTKTKMENVGFRVTDVVYHGINMETVERARKLVPAMRKSIESKLGSGVIFGAILSDHPRKGMDSLLEAFKKVREKNKEAKLYILTPVTSRSLDGVYIDSRYGEFTREEILALIGSFDFLVIPSYCEGFGLPLIEANAMGVPVIHCNYPPLSEITCNANIKFDYIDIEFVDLQEGILYEYHVYRVEDLADSMLTAIDLVKNWKEAYEDARAIAIENAKRFNAVNVYKKLLSILTNRWQHHDIV